MSKILVAHDICGSSNALPRHMREDVSCSISDFYDNTTTYGLVLLGGGEDVCPETYGDTSPSHLCHYSTLRDASEKSIYEVARQNNIPVAGICRGAQLICALNNGSIMHHINGHAGRNHGVKTKFGNFIVNSCHHQMCVPDIKNIVATSEPKISDIYIGKADEEVSYAGPEVEAVVYPETRSVGVQWHPEWMRDDQAGKVFFWALVMDVINKEIDEMKEKYLT